MWNIFVASIVDGGPGASWASIFHHFNWTNHNFTYSTGQPQETGRFPFKSTASSDASVLFQKLTGQSVPIKTESNFFFVPAVCHATYTIHPFLGPPIPTDPPPISVSFTFVSLRPHLHNESTDILEFFFEKWPWISVFQSSFICIIHLIFILKITFKFNQFEDSVSNSITWHSISKNPKKLIRYQSSGLRSDFWIHAIERIPPLIFCCCHGIPGTNFPFRSGSIDRFRPTP